MWPFRKKSPFRTVSKEDIPYNQLVIVKWDRRNICGFRDGDFYVYPLETLLLDSRFAGIPISGELVWCRFSDFVNYSLR